MSRSKTTLFYGELILNYREPTFQTLGDSGAEKLPFNREKPQSRPREKDEKWLTAMKTWGWNWDPPLLWFCPTREKKLFCSMETIKNKKAFKEMMIPTTDNKMMS